MAYLLRFCWFLHGFNPILSVYILAYKCIILIFPNSCCIRHRNSCNIEAKNLFISDAVHVIVQPAGQTKTAEMVRGAPRQAEEEDYTRTYNHCASQEA